MEDKSAAQQIDAIIKKYDDWRGEMMSRLRALIKQADPALPLDIYTSDRGTMMSWRQESLRIHVVPTSPSTFPCLFPAPSQQVQGREADGPLCAAGLLGTPQA